ncbi:MAG TPA: discoidin domain-containing protein, partial [Kutzneria sp.]|nr:discoidin domain-containing protein [Kutzneria sp.]
GSASTTVTVGNTAPAVTIAGPAGGGLFDFGDAVPFQVSVTDPEDGATTGDGGVDDVALSGSGRYVRVYGTQRATQWGYSLWDLNVYGANDLALGRPVTVSSVEPNSPHSGANAVDGNPATRWGSAYSDPQWIVVDLGSARSVNRVRLNWETAYGRAYQIQTSPDNATWTTVYSTITGDGGVDDLAVTGTGRYVRVYGTQRGTQWGYSLWDLGVYGA